MQNGDEDVIEHADQRLKEWATTVLQGAGRQQTPISLALPDDGQAGSGVSMYLLDLAPISPAGHARRLPLQISLRYLVSTWADNPAESHHLLGILVFAALEDPQFEVDLEPAPIATWAAFGVKPRAAFLLRVPLRLDRPEPSTKFVRRPLVIKAAIMIPFHGQVLTTNDIPLAGAVVELPALQVSTRADVNGYFRFSAVPAAPPIQQVTVKAKGQAQNFTVNQAASDHELLVIHFDIREE
ncbi:MAG: carboxypeptidase regulatory-like domain-containing protein [Chloroflexi bacterium]|nr:carboxypeptidase regulatory-like domain-containing protein [Chloroflexota bacterium]